VFGKHSYAFTHFEQHAVACLRNATIRTKGSQAEIVEARKAAEAEEAQCMWLLEERSAEVEFISTVGTSGKTLFQLQKYYA